MNARNSAFHELAIRGRSSGLAHLTDLVDLAKDAIQASLSAGTLRAYATDWSTFVRWCETSECQPKPALPEVVAMFLADHAQAGISPATLSRRIAAIKYAHESAGFISPTSTKLVAATMKGLRRQHGQPPVKKTPATVDRLQRMLAHCDTGTLIGKRDRALLVLGFAGAFRRSELVGLHVADLEDAADGLRVTIRRSKTDQEGLGQTIAVLDGPRMRVRTVLREWVEAAGITEGPLFRAIVKDGQVAREALTDRTVANIVKAYARRAGFNPSVFSGNSLRRGYLSSAAESGATVWKIQEVSRHKKLESVLGYVKFASQFKDHSGSKFM